jgi:membrane protease YdiL (CAAX protease family)
VKNTNLKAIHSAMGFSRINSKVIVIPLLIGSLLWISDYLYQIYFLQNDLSQEARQWITSNNDKIITFVSMVVFAPIIEEIVLRGILLQSLNRYMNKLLAIMVVSIIFTLLHDSYEQWPTLFIASTLYCWLTLHFKSIIPAIVAHILNNALTFILYRLLIM